MQEWLEGLAQNPELPFLAAFALGLLTAIAPCPLATNITATAFISKTIESKTKVLLSGFTYTLGRMFSYTLVASFIYLGGNKFKIAKLFQGSGEKYLGFILIILGLIMLNVIKLNFIKTGNIFEKFSEKFKTKGLLGSFFLGAIFALAFCPYSGALFFGMLMPLTIKAGLTVPIFFSLGTGIPVIFFAFIIAYSINKIGRYFNAITKFEKLTRIFAGITFVLIGLYYINIFFKLI